MKKIIYFLLFEVIFIVNIKAQYNIIQSINFDSEGKTVYSITDFYDYSYILRYDNGNLESWNITELFNLPFRYISSTIDIDGNIWAFQRDWLFKFDGINWYEFNTPYTGDYPIYSHIKQDNQGSIWFTTLTVVEPAAYKLNLTDTTWTIYNRYNSNYPLAAGGEITIEGDSVWVCTSAGLVLIYDDSVSVALDTSNSSIPSQKLSSFYIDSKGNRWLGSYDKGLIKWVNDSTFISYNTSNSNLPNNFINAIDEDSKGTLWLATDNGFASFNGDSITSYQNLYNNSIVAIAVDQFDRVWLGTVLTGTLFIFDGDSLTGITDVEEVQAQPQSFYLSQNYPNPFNPTTTISYQIPEKGYVSIKVFDLLGNEIATLVDEYKEPGQHTIQFDGNELVSGVYFCTLRSGSYLETRKMLLLR